MKTYDIAIIGAGPAGLGVAKSLEKSGLSYIVLERENHIGAIPKSCRHASFGLSVFKYPMTGLKFMEKLCAKTDLSPFQLNSHVLNITKEGLMTIRTDKEITTIKAHHIVVATGCRETPRHARLVSGTRPLEIVTTGALQKMIYNEKLTPFRRPVIIGTEMISFSALLTCLSAHMKPQAMVEAAAHISTFSPAQSLPLMRFIPLYKQAFLKKIHGLKHVEAVTIKTAKGEKHIPCDGVIFTGKFIGEDHLLQISQMNDEARNINQYGRLNHGRIYVCGNVAHPGDRGDLCYLEGLRLGQYLRQNNKERFSCPIIYQNPLKGYINHLCFDNEDGLKTDLNLRIQGRAKGNIVVSIGEDIVWQKKKLFLPEYKISLKNIDFSPYFYRLCQGENIQISFAP